MLLCLLLALVLADGKRAASNYLDDNLLVSLIKFIELVLGMEEFLKHGEIKLSEMEGLKQMMRYFVKQIRKNVHQTEGMGNRLIKNHLYLHIPQYIELWGPATGWDSSPSESHHKMEIKGPSKNTQRNPHTLVKQTCD